MEQSEKSVKHSICKILEIHEKIDHFYFEDGELFNDPKNFESAREIIQEQWQNLELSVISGLFRPHLLSAMFYVDPDRSKKFVLQWVLGADINYDRGIMGYESFLVNIFDAIVEIGGVNGLHDFLQNVEIPNKKKNDPRFLRALFNTLACEIEDIGSPSQAKKWLQNSSHHTKEQ